MPHAIAPYPVHLVDVVRVAGGCRVAIRPALVTSASRDDPGLATLKMHLNPSAAPLAARPLAA